MLLVCTIFFPIPWQGPDAAHSVATLGKISDALPAHFCKIPRGLLNAIKSQNPGESNVADPKMSFQMTFLSLTIRNLLHFQKLSENPPLTSHSPSSQILLMQVMDQNLGREDLSLAMSAHQLEEQLHLESAKRSNLWPRTHSNSPPLPALTRTCCLRTCHFQCQLTNKLHFAVSALFLKRHHALESAIYLLHPLAETKHVRPKN